MQIILTPADLSRACTLAAAIVGKASTENPGRAALLLDVNGDRVRVVAVSEDASVGVVLDLPVSVREGGVAAVNAADLLKVAKALPGATAIVKFDEDAMRLDVTSNFTQFRLPTLDTETLLRPPVVPAEAAFTVAASDLRRVIDQTLFCVAPDDNRYGLNGAHVEDGGEGVVRVVSTDGNRLAWSTMPYNGTAAFDNRALLPRRALAIVRKVVDAVDGPVEVSTASRAARFAVPGVSLYVRLLEAEFPDYRQVLPESFTRRVLVARDDLHSAVGRIAVCARDTAQTMLLRLDGEGVCLSARTSDHGEGTETVPADFAGEMITIGMNARYLADALGAVRGDRVDVSLNDALGAVMIRGSDDDTAAFVVMPLRVDA